jgi:hypothetical protein
MSYAHILSVGSLLRIWSLGRLTMWKYNSEMNLRETGYGNGRWAELAQKHSSGHSSSEYYRFRILLLESWFNYKPFLGVSEVKQYFGYRDYEIISQSMYTTQNCRVLGLCPLSGILETRKQCFGNWICFRPQVREWETPTLLGPIETANFNHRTIVRTSNPRFQTNFITFLWESWRCTSISE